MVQSNQAYETEISDPLQTIDSGRRAEFLKSKATFKVSIHFFAKIPCIVQKLLFTLKIWKR